MVITWLINKPILTVIFRQLHGTIWCQAGNGKKHIKHLGLADSLENMPEVKTHVAALKAQRLSKNVKKPSYIFSSPQQTG